MHTLSIPIHRPQQYSKQRPNPCLVRHGNMLQVFGPSTGPGTCQLVLRGSGIDFRIGLQRRDFQSFKRLRLAIPRLSSGRSFPTNDCSGPSPAQSVVLSTAARQGAGCAQLAPLTRGRCCRGMRRGARSGNRGGWDNEIMSAIVGLAQLRQVVGGLCWSGIRRTTECKETWADLVPGRKPEALILLTHHLDSCSKSFVSTWVWGLMAMRCCQTRAHT